MSGPIVAMVWEGDNVIKTCFKIRGATCPWKAEPGTLRGDYVQSREWNGFHSSDSVEEAEYDIAYWFKPEELISSTNHSEPWIYEEEKESKDDTKIEPKSQGLSMQTVGFIALAIAVVGTGIMIGRK